VLDRALSDLAGRQERVVDTQVVPPLVELPAGVELVAGVDVEQPAAGGPDVALRGFLGQPRDARVALQPFLQGRLEFEEQHAPPALAERPRVLLDERLIVAQVERPDKGEDQAGQVAGRDLLDDPAADLIVQAAERRRAVVEVAQRELNRDVVVKQPQAGALRDRLPDGHLAHRRRTDNEQQQRRSGIVHGWTVGQQDRRTPRHFELSFRFLGSPLDKARSPAVSIARFAGATTSTP
jgi:hypothetical protein